MWHNRCFNTLRFLHFANDDAAPDRSAEDYDRLWILQRVFEYLNSRFAALYNPTEHLAIDEVIVKFKAKLVFRQFIPKKRK
jgi:hypothetical protein